jgi:hypothetical protein
LRLIGDELHAGFAGSSRISVYELQTHPLDLSVPTAIEHASEIGSRIASETTYRGYLSRIGRYDDFSNMSPADNPRLPAV